MLVESDDYFIKALEANGVDVEEAKQAAQDKMENNEWEGVESIPDEILPAHVKEMFATANQVTAKEHVDIQAAFQKHKSTQGISKTCNFPHEATKDDVREAYMRAYDKGIKGMTVYRDGTRDVQVMQTNQENTLTDMDTVDAIAELVDNEGGIEEFLTSDEFMSVAGLSNSEGVVIKQDGEQVEASVVSAEELEESEDKELDNEATQENVEADSEEKSGGHTSMGKDGARTRPKTIQGTTQEIETAYGDLFVTINEDGKDRSKSSHRLEKAGGYTQSFTEALARTISLSLRTGADANEVIKQLDDIRSPRLHGTREHRFTLYQMRSQKHSRDILKADRDHSKPSTATTQKQRHRVKQRQKDRQMQPKLSQTETTQNVQNVAECSSYKRAVTSAQNVDSANVRKRFLTFFFLIYNEISKN